MSGPGASRSALPIKQIAPMRVDAAQIATAQGEAEAVEEIEDLDGDLAAVVHAIAEGGSTEPAVIAAGSQVFCEAGHFAHHLAGEEVVVGDLVDQALTLHQFQYPADI